MNPSGVKDSVRAWRGLRRNEKYAAKLAKKAAKERAKAAEHKRKEAEREKLDDLKIVRFGIWHFLHGVKKSRAAIHFLNLHQDPFCRMDGSTILFESRSSVRWRIEPVPSSS